MGRLEDIAARNKHPGRHRKSGVTMGMFVAIFVFAILIMMIFTDLDERPDVPKDVPAASTEKRIDGVLLYREKRDAGLGSDTNSTTSSP